MRYFIRWLFCCVAWLGVLAARADDTNLFGIGLTATPSPATVGQPLLYSLSVTNNAATILGTVVISNTLPSSVTLTGVTNNSGTVQTGSGIVYVTILRMGPGDVALIGITNVPTALGLLTNVVNVFAIGTTNVSATNVVSAYGGTADLGIALTGATNGALSFDRIAFGVTVTNGGPSTVTTAEVALTVPTELLFLGITPASASWGFNTTNSTLYIAPDSLASGASQSFLLNFQPTNEFTNTMVGTISAAGFLDSNPTNDTAALPVTVAPPPNGSVSLTRLGTNVTLNLQTGWLEETVRVKNIGTNTLAAVRIGILDTNTVVANATGTNGFDPFVTAIATFAPGETVDVVLEYFSPKRRLDFLPDLLATPVLVPQMSVPTGTGVAISRWLPWSTNRFLIEFPATTGARYTVVYSYDALFSNALPVVPSLVAAGDRVQWIDHGPPNSAGVGINYLVTLTNSIPYTTTNSAGTNITAHSNVVVTLPVNSTTLPTNGRVIATNGATRFFKVIANP
ncbi:MAG TPA: hypothetical protein VMF06_01370 [Candidatus Limnocylindria bacterium]|jgi:hypothetical protein|nr:hypothetical protein [Candidatus Limnocylindria bacterium]